jgi:hypothetical protein
LAPGGAGLEAPDRREEVTEFCLLIEIGACEFESCLLIPARARSAVEEGIMLLMPDNVAATLLRVLVLDDERW